MRKIPVVAVLLCVFAMCLPALAQLPPECGTTLPEPYVFILLDISGSMNHSALCTQAEYDAGQCGYVCSPTSGSQCHTPMQGDHPGSKWYQVRQALYNVLSGIDDVRFGFATFSNQDAQRVLAKHWLYQATAPGPTIPTWGPYPALGSQEVFGARWSCTAGASDGCSVSVPADLVTTDPWEITRMQRLPKGGDLLTETVTFYLRRGSSIYRVRYAPVAGGTLGGPIQTTVTTVRCLDSTCASIYPVGTQTVSWQPVGDFLSWENATSTASRYQPFSYFNQGAASDSTATGICSQTSEATGWEPNADDAADASVVYGVSYNVKQPTDATDPRGPFFSMGDVIPLDWLNSHKQDVLARLAPNLALDPLAAPDFRTAVYFQDHPLPGDPPFLRLRNEEARPVVPFGQTALGVSLRSFRGWFDGCTACSSATGWNDVAAVQDPDWACRRIHLLVITDSQEECPGPDPCGDIAALRSQTGLTTSAMGLGMNRTAQIDCMAGFGEGLASYPRTRQQIEQALTDFFDFVRQP